MFCERHGASRPVSWAAVIEYGHGLQCPASVFVMSQGLATKGGPNHQF